MCVCAVAPVHSSVELSVENSVRLSADYNAQQHVIYWLSKKLRPFELEFDVAPGRHTPDLARGTSAIITPGAVIM